MKMNLDASIENINYLRYMQQHEEHNKDSNVNQNSTWNGCKPPQSNKEK